jgi:hypothetical protein
MRLLLLPLFLLASTATAFAQGAQPIPRTTAGCPAGYATSGGFCNPMRSNAPRAVPKGSSQCPSGWAQSGSGYCVEMRPRR